MGLAGPAIKMGRRGVIFSNFGHPQVMFSFTAPGYDAECAHVWCREKAGIRSWILPAVHRANGTAGGYWSSVMAQGLPRHYGRRWAAESSISGMKHVIGP
jgi:hypothetical protein